MSKKGKHYTEHAGAKLHPHTAKIIKDSKYNYREAIEYFANKISDPVENLKIRKTVLTDRIEKIMIREINPLKAELGDVEYKLKQLNIDVTVEDYVLDIARRVKNLYNRNSVSDDMLNFIRSDKKLVSEINRCDIPFDEFISIVERLIDEE